MGGPEPGTEPRSYWEPPKPLNGCAKVLLFLVVGLGLASVVFVVLILLVAFLMNGNPAFR
jgi:hypothetical protein